MSNEQIEELKQYLESSTHVVFERNTNLESLLVGTVPPIVILGLINRIYFLQGEKANAMATLDLLGPPLAAELTTLRAKLKDATEVLEKYGDIGFYRETGDRPVSTATIEGGQAARDCLGRIK